MVKKKILIPDDSELLELLNRSFLHRETFEFLVARCGTEARQMIEEHDPILAILDLDMEGLSGDACCREIKNDPFLSDTPMALIATSSHPEPLERCQSSGCDAILTKPLDKNQLLGILCQLLEIELRGEPRMSVDLSARLRRDGERVHDVQAVDLNHGGLFLHTLWLHPSGTRLQLNLFVPGVEGSLTCTVEVVWVNHQEWLKAHRLPVGMGIRFIDPDTDFSQAIDKIYTSSAGH
ncbi:MAG: hypothetical protein C0624_10810 [Desulfuromonas sp.]|nr:MAG: hypothetical protein C0624_10810 [Desulfuromonas sp.]